MRGYFQELSKPLFHLPETVDHPSADVVVNCAGVVQREHAACRRPYLSKNKVVKVDHSCIVQLFGPNLLRTVGVDADREGKVSKKQNEERGCPRFDDEVHFECSHQMRRSELVSIMCVFG